MTSRDFCYWLQGYFEIANATKSGVSLTPDQVFVIRNHLAMVFVHEIDPSFPKEQQAKLEDAHAANAPSHHIGGVGPNGQVYRC